MATSVIDPSQGQPVQPSVPDLETPEQKYARLYSGPVQNGPPQPPPAPVPLAPTPAEAALASTLASLESKFEAMAQRLQAPQPAPVAPGPVVPVVGWVEKIRQGDFEGAEQTLIATVRKGIEGEVTQKAYQDALAATQVQLEIDRHITKVRMENPDLARFERYLQAPVNSRVEAERAAGRIHSSEDFVRVYKEAVDKEVLELRNLGLQYRADGKQEALTRTQDVRGAFTPPPQQVGDHSQSQPTQPPGESQDDYFARRNASAARLRNLQV